PQAVGQLHARGHEVRVHAGAGNGAGFADKEYDDAGARLVTNAAAAFDVDLVVRVKDTGAAEWNHLRPDSMLFSFMHLGSHPAMVNAFQDRRVTAFAFDTVEDGSRRPAILGPMSVIAGELSLVIGANLLLAPNGGRGVAIGGARVVIFGAGNAGAAAAATALALGADVTVLAPVGQRLALLAHKLGSSARTIAINADAIETAIERADLVIGAANVAGGSTPKLLTRAHLRAMGEGAVLIEVCIDGGGIAETARMTSHSAPTYVDEGVVHYCVPNMPAAVPRSASMAISTAVLPYVTALADKGLRQALVDDAGLLAGLQMHGGRVTHAGVARELGVACADLDALLFSC
ncbi:MAG: NAD(P)-dependent oxidoreductase, partial [Usitatibacteraceae bacterium]